MASDPEFLSNVKTLESAFDEKGFAPGLAGIDPKELCKIYDKIKGPLDFIIPIVEKIPVYGKAIAQALRLLKMFGDSICTS
jgi:hypothetical protein